MWANSCLQNGKLHILIKITTVRPQRRPKSWLDKEFEARNRNTSVGVMDAHYKTDDDHPNNHQTIQKTVAHDDKDSNGQHASLACQPRHYAGLGSSYHRIAFGHRARHLSDSSKSTTPLLPNINDNGYWVFLLQTRLSVKLTGKRRNNALL
jgi:hypothetical protein